MRAWIALSLLWVAACSEPEASTANMEPELPTPILPAEDEPDPAAPEGAERDNAAPEDPSPATASSEAVPSMPEEKSEPAKHAPSHAAKSPSHGREAQAKSEPTEAHAKSEPTQASSPEPSSKPASHTHLPRTENVRVSVDSGLQKLLDGDSRMQPWVNKVMQVADRCYAEVRAKDASASGAIKVRVTMHENERPTPDIKNLPPALSGVVACATGALFQVRMPLFTGPEGQHHDLAIHFTP